MIFQNLQPKEKLQLNAHRGGSLACFRGPRLALWHFPKDCSQGWHTGAKQGDSELKAEILKLCNSFTSSIEPARGPAHRGQELHTSSRHNKRAADVPGQW